MTPCGDLDPIRDFVLSDVAAFRFSHTLRVRWGECDMQGIVFNPHYMAYVDVALTEYWRAIGLPYPRAFLADGTDMFMVAATQNYRDAARFDEAVRVRLRIDYLGVTSFRFAFALAREDTRHRGDQRADGAAFAFALAREDTLLVDGTATYVLGDRETRAPRPLGPAMITAITAFETTPPARKPA